MNSITDWLEGAGAYRLGWTLIHSLWQGALIAGAFFIARMALRRSSAQARYLAGCGALALLAAAPVLTFLTGPEALFPFFLHLASAPSLAGGAVALTAPASGTVVWSGGGTVSWAWSVAALLDKNLPWLVAAWLLGLMVFLTRWFQGCWWVRRVKRRHVAEVGAEWVGRLNALKCRLAVWQPVRLLESAVVDVPMVVGWLRPVILLPASALSGLTPAQLEAILAHELAHVRRHDYLVNSVQHLIEAFLFYHPAAWWLSRCIREEREHCCDDLVVGLCGDRLGYARALMTLEELRGGCLRWAVAAGGGSLLQRIRRLLGVAPSQQPVGAREFSGLALMGLGCLCLFAGVALMCSPKEYQATCRIKIHHQPAANVFSDPWFPQTEFEVIQSHAVLNRVVGSLQLRRKWTARAGGQAELTPAETLARLKARLNLRLIRNTSLVEVQVRDEDANEAASIANAVAEAYQQYQFEAQRGREQEGLRVLERRRAEVEQDVGEAQRQINELRAKLKLPADVADANALAQPLSAETLRRIESLRVETQNDLIRQQTLLEKLKALAPDRDQLAEVLPSSGIGDALLSSLLEQKTLAEQRLVSLQKEFGPQHAEVLKAASQVEELRAKLQEREKGILVGLEVKVASLKEGLSNLQAEVEHAIQAQADFARQAQPYLTARSHLEGLQKIRDALDMRIATEKTEQELQRDRMVELLDQAVAPARPSSPSGRLAGALLGCGLVLVLLGIVLARNGPGHLGVPALA